MKNSRQNGTTATEKRVQKHNRKQTSSFFRKLFSRAASAV
jgi:predicted GIY-YIG superfamily endonuclease